MGTDWMRRSCCAAEREVKDKSREERIEEFERSLPLIISYQGEAFGEALRKSFYAELEGVWGGAA